MSIITSNASCNPLSISVTGKTNGSGTISWSLPTVPTSGTINSCKLTGTCTISESSDNPATVKVNGTSVSSGVAFTINLGTGNTTTSVAVTATGPHKNTKSTITFSNLVYTVDYETNVTYTVTFKDWDGNVLKTETVKEGSSATAPSDPIREGYKFIGWDKTFSNVTSNLTVTAQYEEVIRHLVARYTANTSGVVPTFNANYDRIINETETNGIYTVEIHSSEDFSKCIFGGISSILSIEYLKITSNVTDMSDMFYNCTSLKQINTTEWDTSNVITMRNAFQKCSSLTSLDVSLFDVSKVTRMDYMFDNCTLLTSVGDLSKWSANNLINTTGMFSYCDRLTSINLSNLKPNALEYIGSMFAECRRLSQIDLSNLDLNTAISTYNLFKNDYNLIYVNMQNSDYTSVNKIIGALIPCTLNEPGVLNIKGIDDITQVDTTTANSKYWNITLEDEEVQPSYTVTFKDWDGTILKTQIVEKGTSATAPSNPIRTGYEFIGWDAPFDNITSDLVVTAQYEEESEEPSEPSSENLFPKFNSDSWAYEEEHEAYLENKKEYDTDVSFETGYYSIYTAYGQLDIIKGKTVKLGVSSIDPNIYIEMGEYRIDNSTLEVIISVGDNESYNLSIRSMSSGYITGSIKGAYLYIIDDLPEITTYTVTFKDWDGTTLKTQNVEDGASATAPDDPTRDGYVFTGWDIDFSNVTNDLIVTAQYEKIEEPDNNELVQGDINDESGAFEDEVSNVVKTKYIDVSDKKQILVNVLTEDVYILKCYLYNANKELVKIIDISADKKRMFGLDLQKLIEEVMNDGNE